jgi:threonine/homoserine/homoserine lactone efflux protein
VKYVGTAYLIFLGVQKFVKREDATEKVEREAPGAFKIFSQGVLANTLNPKTALFFFAFLPQFVDVSRGSVVALQILFLGLTFTVLGLCSDGSWALVASAAGSKLKQSSAFLRRQRYVAGSVCLGLGLATAREGSSYAAASTLPSSCRLATWISGTPEACFAAPAPGRIDGRFTQAVAMPIDFAGMTS